MHLALAYHIADGRISPKVSFQILGNSSKCKDPSDHIIVISDNGKLH